MLSVNAEDPLTARMYIHRAAVEDTNLPPSDSWLIGDLDATTTKARPRNRTRARDVEEELYERALYALLQELGADDLDEVREQLKIKVDFKEPVFVALRAHTVTAQLVRGLRSRLKGVSLFLLTGADTPNENLRELAVLLEPELEPGTEEAARSSYAAGIAAATAGLVKPRHGEAR